jgi:hypothetical protein
MVILCMAAAMREPSHLPMHADQIATQADGAAMKIGILGTGHVACSLAGGFVAAGHAVTLRSRAPESKAKGRKKSC